MDFMKFDIFVFFENLSKKLKFHSDLTRITGTLQEAVSTFITISRSVLFRMRTVSDKSRRENQHTHCTFNNVFRKSCRLSDNVEKHCSQTGHRRQYKTHALCMLDE
jgi:hypothetical protein